MTYLYETHLHTSQVSLCAVSKGKDYIKGYIDKGYSGIIVTDHFYKGNTCLNGNLPWREWVNQFCSGFEQAWEEGQRRGLDVFFGWEETFDACDDYLVYGLDKDWLLDHPEVRYWSRYEQYRAVKAAGGCVVQAHPFRQHHYVPKLVLPLGCVDAVEAANGGNNDSSYDALAMRYAKKNRKPITAGTDIHSASVLNSEEIFGVYLNRKIESISDYVTAICNNEIAGIKTSAGRCDSDGSEKVVIPVEIHDAQDKCISTDWKSFC